VSGDGILGSLSVVGLLSLCCIGLGGIAGGAAVAGGRLGDHAGDGNDEPSRRARFRVVTAVTVLVVGVAVKRRLRRSSDDDCDR